jgi:thioredoxin-related protein
VGEIAEEFEIMKKWMVLLFGLLAAARTASAAPEWLTSVPAAEAEAKKDHKLVLLYFTGSDWCEWCLRMDAEIFAKPEFERYASTNLALVMLDYPVKKPQPTALKDANEALRVKYNIEIYPTLLATTPEGKIVWTMSHYPLGGLAELTAQLDEARKKVLHD